MSYEILTANIPTLEKMFRIYDCHHLHKCFTLREFQYFMSFSIVAVLQYSNFKTF